MKFRKTKEDMLGKSQDEIIVQAEDGRMAIMNFEQTTAKPIDQTVSDIHKASDVTTLILAVKKQLKK